MKTLFVKSELLCLNRIIFPRCCKNTFISLRVVKVWDSRCVSWHTSRFEEFISGLPGAGSLGLFTLPVNPIYILGREEEFLHAFSSPRIEILSYLMSVLPDFAFIQATDFSVSCSLK